MTNKHCKDCGILFADNTVKQNVDLCSICLSFRYSEIVDRFIFRGSKLGDNDG